MRVLVACEFSGRVRDAFCRRGHDAWSCDLVPSELPGQHIIADVRTLLSPVWDLLIAFPPCTFLSDAANGARQNPGRTQLTIQALALFADLFWSPIARVCVENPKGTANTMFVKPSQRIDPFMFGDPERKRNFLWLRGLPPLMHRGGVIGPPAPLHVTPSNGKRRYLCDARHAGRHRSRTFPGIALAMAEQWG